MRDDRDLMKYLETLETSDPALTDAEMQRLTKAVLHRTACGAHQAKRAGKERRAPRRLPAWGQVLLAGAACAVLLVGLNGINPALAEGLPLLGDVFAYFNDLPKGYLQGNDLGEYAQSARIEAEVQQEKPSETSDAGTPQIQAAAGDVQPPESCSLTLSQIYCDEFYLRVGLVLTAEDDTLAGFDAVTIDPPMLDESVSRAEADTLYGGVTLNGETIGGDLVPCFRKQDDHTFFCEMQYNLQDYTGNTRDMQASLTLSNLVGVNWGDSAVGSERQTPLDGIYSLSFTVSADASLTRVGQIRGGEQQGIRLVSLETTPGETRVTYTVSASALGAANPALQVFTADGERLEAAGGTPSRDGETTTVREYLDAVPQDVDALTVRAVDKNSEELTVLAEWTVTLP